jgi:putative Holliday junction resolvase
MDEPVRLLAIDPGDKRTGLAIGDTVTRLVTPLEVIELPLNGDALIDALARAIAANEATRVVVGLPLNMDGTEGPRAKLVRAFGERLSAKTVAEVVYQDERLTSVEADWAMAQSGLTHKGKKKRRDALAAAAILRDYLETFSG